MKRTAVAVAVTGACAAAALTMSFGAAAARQAPPVAADSPCYTPEFTVQTSFGGFTASSSGTIGTGDNRISWTLNVAVTGNNGAAWSATPGTLDGTLTATIHVPGVAHPIQFVSTCIQEAAAAPIYVRGTFEGHLDLPPWTPGGNQALLSVVVIADVCRGLSPTCSAPMGSPLFGLAFLLHGTTCNSQQGAPYAYGFEGLVTGRYRSKLKGSGDSFARDRADLPGGPVASLDPCPGTALGFIG